MVPIRPGLEILGGKDKNIALNVLENNELTWTLFNEQQQVVLTLVYINCHGPNNLPKIDCVLCVEEQV